MKRSARTVVLALVVVAGATACEMGVTGDQGPVEPEVGVIQQNLVEVSCDNRTDVASVDFVNFVSGPKRRCWAELGFKRVNYRYPRRLCAGENLVTFEVGFDLNPTPVKFTLQPNDCLERRWDRLSSVRIEEPCSPGNPSREVAPGVRYYDCSSLPGHAHVVTIEKSIPGMEMRVLAAPRDDSSFELRSLPTFAAEAEAVVAINGMYWSGDNGILSCCDGKPDTSVYRDDQQLAALNTSRLRGETLMGFARNTGTGIQTKRIPRDQIPSAENAAFRYQAYGATAIRVGDEPVNDDRDRTSSYTQSIVGYSADKIVMLVGAQDHYVREYRSILKAFGVTDAVQNDGGPSARLIIGGAVNRDIDVSGRDRSIAYGIGLVPVRKDPTDEGTRVECTVFDDGGANESAASDALYFAGPGRVCVGDGTAEGNCRKWFSCRTVEENPSTVQFQLFNDGSADAISTTAIYAHAPNEVCAPDNTPTGQCRRWLGEAKTEDGRNVDCRLFGDAYADPTARTTAIYFKEPARVCLPDGTPEGTCAKWFGRCVAH